MSTLLGDLTLDYVQRIEHALDGGFAAARIAGLEGELQQRSGRPSHRVFLSGLLLGEDAGSALAALQEKAKSGEELTFAANITTALELQNVVITSFRAVELAGQPKRFAYEISLAESPPLPPPASLEPFGGLDGFGLGDLGFDTDILGDLQDLAGDIQGAVNDAMDIVDQLGALASLADLGDLQLGNFLDPMTSAVNRLPDIGRGFRDASRGLVELFGT
jgi:hypothetical protein